MIEVDLLPRTSAQGGRRASSTPVPRKPLRFLVQDPWVLASALVFVLCAAASGLLLAGGSGRTAGLGAALEAAVLDSARTAKVMASAESVTVRLDSLRARVAVIRELDARRYIWPRLFDELAKALPREAWFVQIAQLAPEDGRVRFRVEGKTYQNFAISRFWEGLESSEFVHDVRLVNTEHLIEPAPGSGELHGAYFFVLEADYRDSRPQIPETAVLTGARR